MRRLASNKFSARVVAAILLLAVVVTGAGLFAITSTAEDDRFRCVFEEAGDECVYTVTLPAEREASLYSLNLEFLSVADTAVSGETVVSPIATRNNKATRVSRGYEYLYSWYLLAPPSSWSGVDYEDVFVSMTGEATVTCVGSTDRVRSFAQLASVSQAYPFSEFRVCDRDQCRADNTDYLLREYTDSSGNQIVSEENQARLVYSQVARCYRSSSAPSSVVDYSEYSFESVVSADSLFGDDSRFAAYVMHLDEGGHRSNSWSHTTPEFVVGYYASLFPSDVRYSVGGSFVEELSGVQRGLVSSVDFAGFVNSACRSGGRSDSCSVDVVFSSSEAGVLVVDSEERVLRLFDVDGDSPPPQGQFPGDDVVVGSPVDEDDLVAGSGVGFSWWFVLLLGLVVGLLVFLWFRR